VSRPFVQLFSSELKTRTSQFVALKVLRADSTKGIPTQPKEADILQHVAQADPSHPGHQHVVKILDSFMHVGPHGEHSCIVFEALGESVLNLQKRSENGRLSLDLVRSIARQTLLGLDYLHRSCRLVHTGMSPISLWILTVRLAIW
jgi:serine/threonine-protein kinase SRPK3